MGTFAMNLEIIAKFQELKYLRIIQFRIFAPLQARNSLTEIREFLEAPLVIMVYFKISQLCYSFT